MIDSTGDPVPGHVRDGRRPRQPRTPTSTYMLNGTIYQQALSAMYWMNYRGAQRLAVLQDETRRVQGPRAQGDRACRRSAQAREPADRRAGRAGHDDDREGGGRVEAELRAVDRRAGARAANSSRRCATPATRARSPPPPRPRSPAFLAAAGAAGEGAFVTATATPLNTPTAEPWSARFEQRYQRKPGFEAQQGYDAVRTLAHAINRSRSTESGKVLKAMTTLDAEVRELARRRAVRRRPHAALRQPRHPRR